MIPYFQVTKFNLGFFSLQSWGTMVALGFLAGIFIAYQEVKRRGSKAERILDISFWIILGSFVGARLFYLMSHINLYQSDPLSIFEIWGGGLTFYGGFLGALVAFLLFIRIKRIPFWALAEPIMFSLPLGIFIGRIGCFLIHDHIGKITAVPWGLQYLDGTIRHETALYDSLSGLVLFFLFLFFKRFSWSKREGFFTTVFLLWYGLGRFGLDFFRASDLPFSDVRFWGLTFSQYASILFFMTGLYLFKRYLINFSKNNHSNFGK